MSPDDRNRLARVLASFDEAGLVALANVGLVRRARKDLEAGGVTHEETDAAVVVHGPDWAVTMPPDGPTRAADTTRATGITRHILAATIYLRDTWAGPPTPGVDTEPAPGEALAAAVLALTIDDLQKWAGKTVLKETLALVDPLPIVEIDMQAGLTIRLVQHGVEARLFPGTSGRPGPLLDAIHTTGPKAQHARWVTFAVLAFQASRGITHARLEQAVAAGPTGAPVTRRQVLLSARELFAAMAATGLAHLSDRTAQRLFTLSVSATAVLLPRLARLVRAIADDVELALECHAAADPARLFERLSTADALARALLAAGEDVPARLAGRPRTEYDPAGDLTLAGVGAFPWQSASGFEGVTVLFWDAVNRRFLTWTASRPVETPGRFGAAAAYRHERVWHAGTPEALCWSRLTLRGGKVNPEGRLSSGKESAAEVVGPTDPAALDFGHLLIADWAALAAHADATAPLGLAEPQPLDRVVVLRPTAWGERVFDESRQCLNWAVLDAAGNEIALTLPWIGVNEPAVEFLEAVKPDRDGLTYVVARLAPGGGLIVEPLALLGTGGPHGHKVLNPGFDRNLIKSRQESLLDKLRAKYGRDRVPTTLGDEEEPGWTAWVDEPAGGLVGRLRLLEGLLVQLAETGTGRGGELGPRLREVFQSARGCGLSELHWPADESARPSAEDLLRAGYLVALHRQAARASRSGIEYRP